MELDEFLNKDINEKYELISTRNLFETMSEENLAKIMTSERMRSVVFNLAGVLTQEKAIQEKIDFTPFINSLSEENLPRVRKYLIIKILIGVFYRREDAEKNNADLMNFISILKQINDPLLITYSVRSDT